MGAYDNEVVNLFSLTIRDEDVVSKVDTIIEIIQKLGLTTQEAMNAVREALITGFLDFGEANEAWKKLADIADASAEQIKESAQGIGEATQGMVEQFDEALGTGDLTLEELAQKWAELSLAAEESAQQVAAAAEEIGQAGQQMAEETVAATEQVAEATQGMATSTEAAMARIQAAYDAGLMSFQTYEEEMLAALQGQDQVVAAAPEFADAFAIQQAAVQEETQVVSDYISMLDSLGGAGEAATAGMFSLDQAIGDATTTYNELDDASATAAYDVQAVGNEAETAGEKVSGASEGFGASQYILFQLGFMAFSAAQQFFTLGVNAQDALTIIQGKTGASDQQMQEWTDTLEQMGLKGGYSLDVMAQGLDIVTQAQFKGADATTVLQYAMELARASGSKLTDSTNLLSMSMVAFGAKASDAHTYAAILFDALSNGKQNIQELTNALGPVVGEAAQAGIGFEDLVSAETDFSRSSSSSMEATRGFQGLIQALAGDSQLTTDQIVKLGLAFDQTKFQTLDFAGKLEFLAKYTDGNVQEFTQLIGGMKDAQDAMSTLDISTHQLAVNADTLGLSFSSVKYNSLDAADKLYYLLQVSGYNEAEFKKLTDGGVNPLNDALLKLDLSTQDVANRAKQMGLNFDEAKFKTDDLKQKLLDLWDASGHNIDAFGKLIGGSKDVGAAFGIMGLSADGTNPHLAGVGNKADDLGNLHLSKNAPIQVHMYDLQRHLQGLNDDLDKNGGKFQTTADKVKHLDDAYSKTSQDIKASSDKASSGFSELAQAFVTQVAPVIIPILYGLGSAADWAAHHLSDLWNGLLRLLGPIGMLAASLNELGKHISDIIMWLFIAWAHIKQWVNDTIDIFAQLSYSLVGGSIIPDMINKIEQAFINAGPTWLGAITTDINSLLSAFDHLASQMYTSAVHAVQQFVAGLLSQIGNVENAASQIAAKVASFLHHSKPDVGPMADDDQWMPDFMEMLATGMEANISRLTHASSQVAQSLIPPVGYGTSPLGSQQSITPIVTLLTQILSVLQAQRGGQGGSGVPPSVTMNNVFAGGGTSSVGQLYSQLDQLAGIRFEAGLRGAL